MHTPNTLQSAAFSAGHPPTPGAGRPRKPSLPEALRDRVEADLEAWIRPLERLRDEAIDLRVVVDPRSGQVHEIEREDLGARAKATEMVFRWVYGAPQRVEVSGADGGPIELRIAFDIGQAPRAVDAEVIVDDTTVSQSPSAELEAPESA